jgi:hypothetical protein
MYMKTSCVLSGRALVPALVAALGLALFGCENPDGGNPAPERYTLTFDARGGTEVDPVTADAGTEVPRPADPALDGRVFDGWHDAAEGGTAYDWPHALLGSITMYAQWLPDAPIALSLWVNEDGEILASNDNITISKSGSGGYFSSFTAGVTSAYTGVQWTLTGAPLAGNTASSIVISAADYPAAKTYILGVVVTKDDIPYSSEIRFTVID